MLSVLNNALKLFSLAKSFLCDRNLFKNPTRDLLLMCITLTYKKKINLIGVYYKQCP